MKSSSSAFEGVTRNWSRGGHSATFSSASASGRRFSISDSNGQEARPDHRRDLYTGFGDTLGRAFELVATPLVFGLMGYGLDRWLGTLPIFTLILSLFVLGYMFW